MTETTDTHRDALPLSEILHPLSGRGRHLRQATIVALLLTLLLGIVHYLVQPITRTTVLEFKPMFEGFTAGRYPNGLAFAVSDIVNPSILDAVHTQNGLQSFCDRDAFQEGVTVQQYSGPLVFLDLEYQSRLSDARLTTVDRQRLQDEYSARRALVPIGYRLAFIQTRACVTVPQALVAKTLNDVLESWANESEHKRGVMKLRVSVLSPALFEGDRLAAENLLVKADLLRTSIVRVITNILEVERLPGAETVRGTDRKISLREVRTELEDLIQAKLDPLVAQAGRGLGRQAASWIEQALQAATIRERQAQQFAESYRSALREYTGLSALPAGGRSPLEGNKSSSDVQTLTPQIDRTFIDRIVELSAANTTFRQEITRKAIEASVDAVEKAAIVSQYKELLTTISRDSGKTLSPSEVSAALENLTAQARDATRRFNEVYEEFSRVSLRIGPQMYRIETPAQTTTIRPFGAKALGLMLIAVAVAVPTVLAISILVRSHGRRFFSRAR